MPQNVIDHALDRDLTEVRDSAISGKGLFAKREIHKGARIIEYQGKHRELIDIVSQPSEDESSGKYFFHLTDAIVIDGAMDGNDARFINHSCEPNCDALIFGEKVFIYALRDLAVGEELAFDYQLRPALAQDDTVFDNPDNRCNCGSPNCRGSMLAAEFFNTHPRPTN